MKAYLIPEDGTVFTRTSISSGREAISEIMFSTLMTGYLEVLAGPSYARQVAVMTYPLVGDYGIYHKGMESAEPWPDDYIVGGLSRIPSNFRSKDTVQNFLKEYDVPGIYGIGTRTLTRILREKGIMNDMITTEEYTDFSEPIKRVKECIITGAVLGTATKETYVLPGNGKKVALLDYGAKRNIVRSLNRRGYEVTVYPADALAEKVLAGKPDGIMLNNGPGDPKENTAIIREVEKLYESNVPTLVICLGRQLMALANDMDTRKLEHGHRGGNHPVKDLETGRVYISSQNHDYVADADSLDPTVAVPAPVSASDSTSESLKYAGKSILTMQYHLEACPRPLDSGYLFDRFLKMMEANN